MNFKVDDKVKPINKTAGHRDFDNSATHYKMLEIKQNFLYVIGVNEEESRNIKEVCYWCGVYPGAPMDIYKCSDIKKIE
ncbi:hypothetical protein [Bacillus atrophaeus]|uniref:hypothetical protein n=1 Tax=Bacillus atrophaeus TaxID=1452 RepID=UPI002E002487|nr:hypothetical protein [Bacillus atrophaeus]